MSQSNPLSVAELLSRYLHRQVDAHTQGLGYAEPGDEATPFESAPVQPVDPQLAWQDAVAVASYFGQAEVKWSVPAEWATLVNQQEPAVAVAFCLGNYPQLVRNPHPLLTSAPTALRQSGGVPLAVPAIQAWAEQSKEEPRRYLAAGLLRLARQFARAEELLRAEPSATWRAVHANEVAALAWHRGLGEKAIALWQAETDSVPVLMNRGMAAVFLGRGEEAIVPLDAAIAQLPEVSAWYHLAQVYRTLAEAR